MLRAIFTRQGLEDVDVEVRYPNYGLFRDGGRRAVLFHHGHFIEPIYTAMTFLQRAIFPHPDAGTSVADWEARNFAWIDFFWSTLGRSGDVGENVGLIYDMLEDPGAVRLMADNVLDAALPRFLTGWKRWLRRPIRWYVGRRIAAGVGGLERRNPAQPLSPGTREGLRRYLEGPLAAQLFHENRDGDDLTTRHMPDETTFIFGHTHKPFQQHWDFVPHGVSLYNSGGWVVDTTSPDVRQGAAVILVDDELHTASLHLYQQGPDGPISPVSPQAIDPLTNPLVGRLQAEIHADEMPWKALTTAISDELPRRRDALQRLIANGKARLGSLGRATSAPGS
jgi:hypothetical protein